MQVCAMSITVTNAAATTILKQQQECPPCMQFHMP
jgi:hypothetical protein